MGDAAEWQRDHEEALEEWQRDQAEAGVLPGNPWDDLPGLDQAAEAPHWSQWGLTPQELAVGVEKDLLGTTVQVVQVRIVGAPRAYGYGWWGLPSGSDWLAVGDWVRLPGNVVSPDGCKGRVEAYGRAGYAGKLKDVACRMDKPDLWQVQMEAVRDKPTALKVYRAAQRDPAVSGERLAALLETGRAALEKAGRL